MSAPSEALIAEAESFFACPSSGAQMKDFVKYIGVLIAAQVAGGGSAVTIADGADVTLGAIADALAAVGAAGTVSAKLRRITQGLEDLKAFYPSLGTALIPSVNIITTQRPSVTQVVSTALEASHILKAAAGQLVEFSVFSQTAQFLLLMNSATLPANGAVTLLYPPIPIAAGQLLVLDLPAPLVASTGIVACNSSTGTFTKTIGVADCIFYAQIN